MGINVSKNKQCKALRETKTFNRYYIITNKKIPTFRNVGIFHFINISYKRFLSLISTSKLKASDT